ncbi:type II CAAX endopeptidase family protein [Arthrobacter rhombi]|uniref:CAAX amino terminal protease family protein n=1 Tax=Arthrobacter rhombi TaxID=71253 RepID=A0A1R4G7H7_9MICC|nr:type II CAAX endopeptidase family protein [Arthrobacter rhombi]SJM64116.1 CAAX amino terminal protease family protein [Arthrobacter rhombi]
MTTTELLPDHATGSMRNLIRRRPLMTFFVLTNVLSWLGWLPYILSMNGLGIWAYSFPEFLGTSQFAGVIPGAFLGPIGSALLVTTVADGRSGLRSWAGRLWRWRVSWQWYAITLLGVPAAMLLTGFAFSGGKISAPSLTAIALYVPLLLLQMITTGLAEEPGWRDFALPRLQQRFGALGAAMILGPLWALWHLPLFLTEWGGWPEANWIRPVAFILFCIAFNVVMSWVFNRTGQSLPLSMLMHVSVNTFASIIWTETFPAITGDLVLPATATGAIVAAVLVIVTTRGQLGYVPGGGQEDVLDGAV